MLCIAAREIGIEAGLRFVYTGNVADPEGQSTSCPACGALLIGRDWYRLTGWGMDAGGRCAFLGRKSHRRHRHEEQKRDAGK